MKQGQLIIYQSAVSQQNNAKESHLFLPCDVCTKIVLNRGFYNLMKMYQFGKTIHQLIKKSTNQSTNQLTNQLLYQNEEIRINYTTIIIYTLQDSPL